MERIAPFLLNKNVIGSSAFRLYWLFKQSRTSYPERRSHYFTRGELERITKMSYNSIQEGLKELSLLKIVILDPFDITRTHFIVNDPKEYEWTEINKRQGLKIEGVIKSDEDF